MEYGWSFQPKYLFETKIMANHNIKLIKIFMLGFNDIFVNNENNLTSSQLFLFSIYMIKNDLNKHWKQKCIKTTGLWNPSKLPKLSIKKNVSLYTFSMHIYGNLNLARQSSIYVQFTFLWKCYILTRRYYKEFSKEKCKTSFLKSIEMNEHRSFDITKYFTEGNTLYDYLIV